VVARSPQTAVSSPGRTPLLRRLDHVAIVVRDTEDALRFYAGRLGLVVQSSEEIGSPHVRLTYLDAGNAYLQLVEPLDPDGPLGDWLREHGEGLHHICFGVDDVARTIAHLNDDGASVILGSGRGRVSGFAATNRGDGVRIECTEFVHAEDVDAVQGWLDGSTGGD
jgi:methylmalonyl-CoA/ethylmalonyl-CoA epimerase